MIDENAVPPDFRERRGGLFVELDSETLLLEWLAPFIADLMKRAGGDALCILCGMPIRAPKRRIEAAAGSVCSDCISLCAELLSEAPAR